jgi:hypothetical protein
VRQESRNQGFRKALETPKQGLFDNFAPDRHKSKVLHDKIGSVIIIFDPPRLCNRPGVAESNHVGEKRAAVDMS